MKPRTFKTIILEDLNRNGKAALAAKIKSITYETFSMGNAVRVATLDMFKSERKELDDYLYRYVYGRFDGMTDCQSSERDHKMERQCKYLTINNTFSEALKKLAATKCGDDRYNSQWEFLCALESFDDAIAKCS